MLMLLTSIQTCSKCPMAAFCTSGAFCGTTATNVANLNNLNYTVHEICKFLGVVFMPHPVQLSLLPSWFLSALQIHFWTSSNSNDALPSSLLLHATLAARAEYYRKHKAFRFKNDLKYLMFVYRCAHQVKHRNRLTLINMTGIMLILVCIKMC